MTVYVYYDSRPPHLPIAVADSGKELAQMTGRTVGSIYTLISKKRPQVAKIELEETDD